MISPLFGRSLDMIGQLLTSLVWVVFIIVCSIYLVKDSHTMGKWLANLPPPDYREDYLRISNEIKTIWSAFFRGQLLLASIVTVILTAVGLLIGLPYALLMGFIGGLLEFFPSLGHSIWLVLSLTLALLRGSDWMPIPNWMFALVVVLITAVFDQFDNNYLVPRIIGRSVRLPALVVILGIVIGASFAGVLGVALAAPSVASLRVVGRYIYARLCNLDPFQEDSSIPLLPPALNWWHKRPAPPKPGTGPVVGSEPEKGVIEETGNQSVLQESVSPLAGDHLSD
jgi:predicted PurR-regulated permease PerM